jgi:hypothetical protein
VEHVPPFAVQDVPQTFATPPPPQVAGEVQLPQFTVRDVPQLSGAVTEPQFLPRRVQKAELLSGVQDVPQTFATPPPPQVAGEVQLPQFTVRDVPQLSGAVTEPQFLPRRVQKAELLSGVQPPSTMHSAHVEQHWLPRQIRLVFVVPSTTRLSPPPIIHRSAGISNSGFLPAGVLGKPKWKCAVSLAPVSGLYTSFSDG